MRMADVYTKERESGMTCREVAQKYGVSGPCIYGMTARRKLSQFKPLTKNQVIYPNIRAYLNYYEVSISELCRRFGTSQSAGTKSFVGNILKGRVEPTRYYIEKLMRVTGLTYEQLFTQEA